MRFIQVPFTEDIASIIAQKIGAECSLALE
jgi:hypothetical protein